MGDTGLFGDMSFISQHYKPLTPSTLAEFQAAMKGSAVKVVLMTEGQSVDF
jgi:hypothetical protein